MKYFIKYGRGDFIEFKTLKEAKQWQRDNILPDYENDQFGIGEDEINNYAWGCKWVKEDDGVWLFTLLNVITSYSIHYTKLYEGYFDIDVKR